MFKYLFTFILFPFSCFGKSVVPNWSNWTTQAGVDSYMNYQGASSITVTLSVNSYNPSTGRYLLTPTFSPHGLVKDNVTGGGQYIATGFILVNGALIGDSQFNANSGDTVTATVGLNWYVGYTQVGSDGATVSLGKLAGDGSGSPPPSPDPPPAAPGAGGAGGASGGSGSGGTAGSGGSGGSGGTAGSGTGVGGTGGTGGGGGLGGAGGAGGIGGAGGAGGQGGEGGVTSVAGVEARIDATNAKLSSLDDRLKNAADDKKTDDEKKKMDPAVEAIASGAASSNQSNSDAISSTNSFNGSATASNGWGSPVAVGGSSGSSGSGSGSTALPDIQIPGTSWIIAIDPIKVATNWGLLPLFAAGRAIIVGGIVLGVYKFILSSVAPLVASLFSSEAPHSSVTASGTAGFIVSGTATASPVLPVISAARIAILIVIPIAVIGIIDAYLSALGGPSSFSLVGWLTSRFETFRSLGGRGFAILDLVLPIGTIIFSSAYSAIATSIAYGAFAAAKAKSAALQSV